MDKSAWQKVGVAVLCLMAVGAAKFLWNASIAYVESEIEIIVLDGLTDYDDLSDEIKELELRIEVLEKP